MLLRPHPDQDHTERQYRAPRQKIFYKTAKQRFDADTAQTELEKRSYYYNLVTGTAASAWSTFIQLSLTHCQQIYQRLGVALPTWRVRAEKRL